MRTLFLLNPAAGKQDCTAQLIPQIEAAARRAGLAPEEVTIHVTEYAGHARKLARAAAQQAAAEGVPLHIYSERLCILEVLGLHYCTQKKISGSI